jgi:hypothetical protein
MVQDWRLRYRIAVAGAANADYSHDFLVGKIGLKCGACYDQTLHTVSTYEKYTMTTCSEASHAETAIMEGGRSM